MYLDIYNFYVPALKPTPSTSNAFSKYLSKAFWEEWTVGKFNRKSSMMPQGMIIHSLSYGKYLTLIDHNIPHGGKYSKPVTNLKSFWIVSVNAFTKKLSKIYKSVFSRNQFHVSRHL